VILISACLVGVNCKYTGDNNLNEKILSLFKEGEAIIVCPEQLGGLTTPRMAAEKTESGKVFTSDGKDVTEKFLKGAEETLKVAKMLNINKAILKKNSPSCGYGEVYNGMFEGIKIRGNGVTSELLSKNGMVILNEDNFSDYF